MITIPNMEKMEKMNCFLNKDDDVLLPGFRFHPTDEELVGFYLRRKVEKKPLCIELIKQIDVYKFDPWDLPISSMGDKEMYFFCIRERKYKNSIRPNRVTGSGFWKATGIDRPIYSVTGTDCIGLKKSLVYYRGSAGKGTKTDWMMHEFRLPANGKNPSFSLVAPKNPTQEAEIWTLCRIFKRNASYRKYAPGWREPSSTKENQYDSPPQTRSSLESDNRGNICFGATPGNEKTNGRQSGPVSLTPFPPSYTAASDCIEFTKDGNWGDFGSIVDFASDPSFMYDCK